MDAHNKLVDTINRLPKDKVTTFGEVKLTVIDKVNTINLLIAKFSLISKDDSKYRVELKIHKPSDKRHKATIGVRKLTGFDYDGVEKVKDLLTSMLDDLTSGESVSRVLIKSKGKAKPLTQW